MIAYGFARSSPGGDVFFGLSTVIRSVPRGLSADCRQAAADDHQVDGVAAQIAIATDYGNLFPGERERLSPSMHRMKAEEFVVGQLARPRPVEPGDCFAIVVNERMVRPPQADQPHVAGQPLLKLGDLAGDVVAAANGVVQEHAVESNAQETGPSNQRDNRLPRGRLRPP